MRKNRKIIYLLLIIFVVLALVIQHIFFPEDEKKSIENKENYQNDMNENITKNPIIVSDNEDVEPVKVSDQDLKTTKDIAVRFMKSYVKNDPTRQEAYLEETKPLMTSDLQKLETENLRRSTLDRWRTTYISSTIYPVEHNEENEIKWNVVVVVNNESQKKQAFKEEQWYWLTFINEGGSWKVKEVTFE